MELHEVFTLTLTREEADVLATAYTLGASVCAGVGPIDKMKLKLITLLLKDQRDCNGVAKTLTQKIVKAKEWAGDTLGS